MKLSIITVNLNNASGLKKTCLSVVAQTFKEFEWIIIDGASEDNSVDIIKQYSNDVNYWISEPDSGIYNAMNKGIKLATGEYLLFLNSGDYLLHPWTLQEVIDEIKASKYADIYFSDAVLDTYQVLKFPENITLDFFQQDMINHQNCLIRRELFKNRLYDESYQLLADYHFYVKGVLEKNLTFFHINTHIAIYDMNGISNKNIEKQFSEIKSILKELGIEEKGLYRENNFSVWDILKKTKYVLPYGLFKLLLLFRDYLRSHKRFLRG